MDMRIADRLRAALAAALLLILMTGCGSESKASPDTQEACLQIGMLFDNFVMERWERDRDVFVSAARELGAEVNVQNAMISPGFCSIRILIQSPSSSKA